MPLQGLNIGAEMLKPDLSLDLRLSPFAVDEDSPEYKYWQQVDTFVQEKVPEVDESLRKIDARVAELAIMVNAAHPELNEVFPWVLDELLSQLEITLTFEQRKLIMGFVIHPGSEWRNRKYGSGGNRRNVAIAATSYHLPPALLLSPENIVDDVGTLKHEYIHRFKDNGYVQHDIQIPIASAFSTLEQLRTVADSEWALEGENENFFSDIQRDMQQYDLNVVYVFYVLKLKELSEVAEAAQVITVKMHETPAEREPLPSYDEGARLAAMALAVEKLSAEKPPAMTAEHFLSQLAAGVLPGDVIHLPIT